MNNRDPYIRSIYRGALTVLCTIVIYLICAFFMIIFATGLPILQGLDLFVILIFPSLLLPLIYNSFALAFAYGDRDHIDEFLMRESTEITLGTEIKKLFTSHAVISIIISTALMLLASMLGVFFTFRTMFPPDIFIGNWFSAVILTPIAFLSSMLARYEAARFYKKLHKRKELEEFNTNTWLIKRIVLISLVYIIASPVAPLGALVFVSFFNIVLMMSEILTVIGLLLTVVFLVFLVWSIKVLSGLSRRKSFLKKLKLLAETQGYALSEIRNPYRSFATSKDQCGFTLTVDGKCFDCIVISTLGRRTPLVFTSPTDAYFLHRLGTEKHHASIHHSIEFLHSSGGEKIIIVDPTPRSVFAEEGEQKRKISVTDKLWGITVYDAESFLGCADRKCL